MEDKRDKQLRKLQDEYLRMFFVLREQAGESPPGDDEQVNCEWPGITVRQFRESLFPEYRHSMVKDIATFRLIVATEYKQ